jgi:hypothetical protein
MMLPHEAEVLQRAIRAIAERARDAYRIVEEAGDAGLDHDDGIMVAAKSLRAELLRTKGELERELSRSAFTCTRCNRRVHWVSGAGPAPGHWAHAEPAPSHEPVID